ncbi:MAG: DUF4142 domain-containing protein [Pseudonocardiaceae bacterium]
MRPPVPRFVHWAVALAVLVALTAAVFQYWSTSQYGTANVRSTAHDTGWAHTQWGPLGPADRDLLVMARQADLCGGSSGRAAQRQASNTRVRGVAQRTGTDYGELDKQVRSVAGKLGVPLPDQPTARQQSWLRELSGRFGPDFDRMFAQRLRVIDGAMLPAITSVRAGTRNDLIRSFATSAAVLVNRHMEDVESTGLIDYSRLSESSMQPPPPVAASSLPARIPPAGQEQHVDQVVKAAAAAPASGSDINAIAAALVLISALLVALCLVGTADRRAACPQGRGPQGRGPQHRGPQNRGGPHRRRHAAQRW